MRHITKLVLVIIIFATGAYTGSRYAAPVQNAPDADIDFMGATPEGVKIYRVKNQKLIVPVFIGVSRTGSISIR